VKKNSFGLLELEMADLERFWKKSPLGPLGVNEGLDSKLQYCGSCKFLEKHPKLHI
jgi:hypothetical protein